MYFFYIRYGFTYSNHRYVPYCCRIYYANRQEFISYIEIRNAQNKSWGHPLEFEISQTCVHRVYPHNKSFWQQCARPMPVARRTIEEHLWPISDKKK